MFPTFPMRTPEFHSARLPGLSPVLERWTARAAAVVDLSPQVFAVPHPSVLHESGAETLQAHYATIIEGVAMAEWSLAHLSAPVVVTGYSMGLYSALAFTGSLPFDEVLTLITEVCDAAHRHTPAGEWAVGAVVGLAPDMVQDLAGTHGLEVTDRYGATTWLLTGRKAQVGQALDDALQRGAPATRLLPLTAPFHATALAGISPALASAVAARTWSDPRVPILSTTTRQSLRRAADVREEVVRNASHAMDWHGTLQQLATFGVRVCVDCGASTSLAATVREDWALQYHGHDFHSLEPNP